MSRFAFLFFIVLLVKPVAGLDFDRDIQPILSDKCFHCHGPDPKTREGKLRLDTVEGATRKRSDGAAIVPGNPDLSTAIQRILSDDPEKQMPPPDSHRTISEEELDKLKQWIAGGAEYAEHWAFVAPKEKKAPRVPRKWRGNPIDAWVYTKASEQGLSFMDEADDHVLLRRLTLDLTGLPPTQEQQDAFMTDRSRKRYDLLVDRLLASEHYGERMAWAWLDIARYSDTNGYQHDRSRSMYPWRDWVVKAYNENMPFDQFTIWQLAGDMLPDPSFEQKLATGFLRNSMINGEGGRIPEENRVEYVFDHLETVGTAWLALTFNCTRCHDHKYDPLTQKDYFRFFAFFNQTPVSGKHQHGAEPPLLKRPEEEAETAKLKAEYEGLASSLKKDEDNKELKADVDKVKKAYDSARKKELKIMVMQDSMSRKTFVLEKGSYQSPKEEVSADVPEALPSLPEGVKHDRLALANWLVSPENPLTARVVMNRLWAQYFGIGLVKTTENFGVQGERPVNQDLLDWLSLEFIRSGWDMKHMVKLIVTSRTYRQSSIVSPEHLEKDPDNRYAARGARYRLPSWVIRDQALSASGLLVPTMGGPGANTYQPPGVWEEMSFGELKYTRGNGDDLYRRSIYLFWRRIVGPTMFFDSADRQVCEVKQKRTNTPLHALSVLNDPAYVEAGRALAATLLSTDLPDEMRIESVYQKLLSRKPSGKETEVLLKSLDRLRKQYSEDEEMADAYLTVGEFRIPDDMNKVDAAALANVCLLILNLDETLTRE